MLEHVSLEAHPGQSVCVLGPNGGGKTTLFRVLLGELEPTAGRVELSGRPAYMAQTERTRLDFPVTALDVALMGTLARRPLVAAAAARRANVKPPRPRSIAWGSPTPRAFASASCPAASASAPCSLERWSRTRACSCSTSRSRAWTPPARR